MAIDKGFGHVGNTLQQGNEKALSGYEAVGTAA